MSYTLHTLIPAALCAILTELEHFFHTQFATEGATDGCSMIPELHISMAYQLKSTICSTVCNFSRGVIVEVDSIQCSYITQCPLINKITLEKEHLC